MIRNIERQTGVTYAEILDLPVEEVDSQIAKNCGADFIPVSKCRWYTDAC